MLLTLSVWQKKRAGLPTLAGEGRLLDATLETFEAAIVQLLTMVEPKAQPFQVVARMGDSSRALTLEPDWSVERVASELWKGYQSLVRVTG